MFPLAEKDAVFIYMIHGQLGLIYRQSGSYKCMKNLEPCIFVVV